MSEAAYNKPLPRPNRLSQPYSWDVLSVSDPEG